MHVRVVGYGHWQVKMMDMDVISWRKVGESNQTERESEQPSRVEPVGVTIETGLKANRKKRTCVS